MSFWEAVSKILTLYGPSLAKGTYITILLAVVGTFSGTIIGLLVGTYKTIPITAKTDTWKKALYKLFNLILSAYITVFRSTPMMVQAMVIYYGYIWITSHRVSPLFFGMVIISINTGAYMAEIVRGGIISIDKGQYEAAHSIEMTHNQTMRTIVLPQAMRNIMPAIGNEFIINMKDSCVLSVISITELFYQTKTASGATFQYFPAFFIAGVIYLILTVIATAILHYVERRMDGPDTYHIHGSQSVPEVELGILPPNNTKGMKLK